MADGSDSAPLFSYRRLLCPRPLDTDAPAARRAFQDEGSSTAKIPSNTADTIQMNPALPAAG